MRPEPRLGEFREGVVMTRFFSDICLVEAESGLEPLREREPVARLGNSIFVYWMDKPWWP